MTTIQEALPPQYKIRFGGMGVKKGTIVIGEDKEKEELTLYSWDVVENCRRDECPAHEVCTYTQEGKCSVMMQYLKSTAAMFFSNFGSELDESGFYRIGMHLMPLYRMLCKFKIAEIDAIKVIITGDTGRKYVHPIFKEIRGTIQLIETLWRNLGLTGMSGIFVTPEDLDFGGGETQPGSYYARLEHATISKKDKDRMKKSKTVLKRRNKRDE